MSSETMSATEVVSMLLNHGETLKQAGLLDVMAKKGPLWLKPVVQKLIVRIRYPELYSAMSQKAQANKLVAKNYKDIAKQLGRRNQRLFDRALDVESKLYQGKDLSDLLASKIPTPPPY